VHIPDTHSTRTLQARTVVSTESWHLSLQWAGKLLLANTDKISQLSPTVADFESKTVKK
jgi:hypothetical protein